MLCSTQHELVIRLAISGLCLIVVVNTRKHMDIMLIFNYVSCAQESVVENSLFMCQILMTIRLHEELFQSKGTITNEEKWNLSSVTRKGFRLREVKSVSGHPQLQFHIWASPDAPLVPMFSVKGRQVMKNQKILFNYSLALFQLLHVKTC